jgi:hypothetical protein
MHVLRVSDYDQRGLVDLSEASCCISTYVSTLGLTWLIVDIVNY